MPKIGRMVLKKPLPEKALKDCRVDVARSLVDFQKVIAIRAAVFMAEQACPFEEEFDGNDFAATHLIGFCGNEPVGCLRLRWFNGFCKLERVCVLLPHRGSNIIKLMLAECFELAARKGYQLMIGQIQERLIELWSHVFRFEIRTKRKSLAFSGYQYVEIDIALPKHPKKIEAHADPYLVIRPEGSWDEPGVLEHTGVEISTRAA